MKILIYLTYLLIFTYCYYFLNKKLTNKWIMLGYPLFFCALLYPIKLIYDAVLPRTGEAMASEYLLIMLYAVAMITLFNFFYGVVNRMVHGLADFQQTYGMPEKSPAKWYLANANNITGAYQVFFYLGGVILFAVVIYHAKI
jgi:hypothetical protein